MAPASRQDVMAEIERQFAGSDRTTALKTVNLLTGKPGDREEVQLTILAQAGGSLDTLRSLVDSAKKSPGGGRASPRVSDAATAHQSQAAAVAQLQAARHVAGHDAVAVVGASKEYYPWRYVFYVAIGLIPVLTLGGAIPILIAASGIGGCQKIVTDARQPIFNRILFCTGIVIACWIALFLLVGGIALLQS